MNTQSKMLHTEDYLIQMNLASILKTKPRKELPKGYTWHPMCLYMDAKKAYLADETEDTFRDMVNMAEKAMNSRITMLYAKRILNDVSKYNLKYQEGKFVNVYA